MIRYLIIMLSCQLLFLLVYDLFLKKETFFNWNRLYLLVTPLISMVVPFIQLEALKTTAPEPLTKALPVMFLEPATLAATAAASQHPGWNLNAWEWLAISGSAIALLLFLYKLGMLFRLRLHATVRRFREYLQVEVPEGEVAFSFFRQIFLGKKVLERKHDHIIEHELVHIRENHSWDLLYFEILRILFWFNPLVYIFQARMTELHEYIADAKMAGNHKKETYQYLLEEVFQTQNISFINSFFNHSLIKKRIVMLHQSRSKAIKKFKYLLMLPLVLGMLVYTSCEQKNAMEVATEDLIENPKLKAYYLKFKDTGISDDVLLEDPLLQRAKVLLHKESLEENEFYELIAIRILHEESSRKQSNYSWEGKEAYSKWLKADYADYNGSVKDLLNPRQPVLFSRTEINPKAKKYYVEYKAMLDAGANLSELTEQLHSKTPNGEVMSEENFYRSGALFLLKKDAYKLSKDLEEELSRLGNMSYEEYLASRKKQKGDVYTFMTIAEKPSFNVPCEEEQSAFACFKESLDAHVRNTFRYPAEAQEKGIQGRVFLNFKIDTDGSVSVLQSRAPHELLDAEARRIIEALPKLTPGKKADGTPVAITFAYPIIFKLGTAPVNEASGSKNYLSGGEDVPFTVIPVKPSFKTPCENGQLAFECFKEKLDAHVIQHFRYPQEALNQGIEGRAYINFRINTDGSVTILNTRAPHQLLDQEARRIIEALPEFNPGADKDGNPLPVTFAYPIVFKLGGAEGGETDADSKSNNTLVNIKLSNSSETGKVSGTLTYDGRGVAGANIYLKGKNSNGVSDFDGNFEIAASANDVIIVQHLDFGVREFKVLP
ncbi:TonB family protein [Robertkochia marina]|uniref:TonB family protein n=1 Tax=Robertkochia marina TaxID=1227945 RepID=A0A4S3M2X2_9FLAO|nr:M56 family metallopeptidase [Robertkochia marina]THD69045.1 TonB family protein [Robertkochia marina]TRZ44868.1 TonB family protein [Robertkochia marina]